MPVNDPPPPLLPAEQVRHPQRRLAGLGGVIEPSPAALDVDRVRDVLLDAFKQVLAIKPALGVPGGSPLKARLDRDPAKIDRVSAMLGELRDAWATIEQQR